MTDWELGNEIMCGPVDRLKELSVECAPTRPEISRLLMALAMDFGPLVNRLMNDDDSDVGMCPTRKDNDEGFYQYFDGTSKKIYKKFAR